MPVRRSLIGSCSKKSGSAYDAAIYRYLSGEDEFPTDLRLRLDKVQGLRYGENPHQRAAFNR